MPRSKKTQKTFTRKQPTAETIRRRKNAERKAAVKEFLIDIGFPESLLDGEFKTLPLMVALSTGIKYGMDRVTTMEEPEPQPGQITLASDWAPQLVAVHISPEDAQYLYEFRDFMGDQDNFQAMMQLMREHVALQEEQELNAARQEAAQACADAALYEQQGVEQVPYVEVID